MKTEQLGVVTSIKNDSGGDISKGYFITVQGGMGNSEEENNELVGVCIADTEDLGMMPVAVSGIVLCVTGGAISKGNKVSCDGAISKITFTDPPTASEMQKVVGMALDASTASGELIRVLIK